MAPKKKSEADLYSEKVEVPMTKELRAILEGLVERARSPSLAYYIRRRLFGRQR